LFPFLIDSYHIPPVFYQYVDKLLFNCLILTDRLLLIIVGTVTPCWWWWRCDLYRGVDEQLCTDNHQQPASKVCHFIPIYSLPYSVNIRLYYSLYHAWNLLVFCHDWYCWIVHR